MQLMTADEFFKWANLPENRCRHFELERGEVVEMPPPGKSHGLVCLNVSRILGKLTYQRGKGYVCINDAGIVVERDPDTMRGPDVTYNEDGQTTHDMECQYARELPRLAVEVIRPGDRINRVLGRVGELIARGVPIVWVVDPESRDVSVHRDGVRPRLVRAGQELTGEDVLPDLRVKVDEFFAAPAG